MPEPRTWFPLVLAPLALGCDSTGSAPTETEPPAVVVGALCLEAIPVDLAFEAAHPNDRREGSFFVRTCDGEAWHADVSVDGDGFIARQRVLTGEGDLVALPGRSFDVGSGDHMALDVMYLARTIDDGATGELVVRGRDEAGRVGRVTLPVSGVVIESCAECGCCDDSVPPSTPEWQVRDSGHYDPWLNSDPSHGTCSPYGSNPCQ